jgi:enoyl-CoA hydratase/carnithine racemase
MYLPFSVAHFIPDHWPRPAAPPAPPTINHCLPAAELLDAVRHYIREVADRATLAIRYTKIAINKLLWHSVNQIMDFSLMSEYVCMNTADHREATTAFREKRQPRFEGR